MKKILFIALGAIVVCIISAVIIGSGTKSSNPDRHTLSVVASFYPLYYFAQQIGGNKITVYNITPAGAEPHDYEPTPQDIARIEQSSLLVLNGGALEPWGDKITPTLKNKHVFVVVAGKKLFTLHAEENGDAVLDPHIWLDPLLAKEEARSILEAIMRIDPANRQYYTARFDNLANRLDALNQNYAKGLKHCAQNDIITSHAAFGYLAHAYGLSQITIGGITPDEEPSAQKIAQISRFAKTHDVRYIFFERLVNPRLSQTIADEAGAKTMVLDPIEGITDREIQSGINYFTIMQHNLTNLRTALQCT